MLFIKSGPRTSTILLYVFIYKNVILRIAELNETDDNVSDDQEEKDLWTQEEKGLWDQEEQGLGNQEEKGSKGEGAEGGYHSLKGIQMPDFINSLPSSFRAARMTGPIAINEATGTLVKNSHLEMFHSDYKLSQGTNFLK